MSSASRIIADSITNIMNEVRAINTFIEGIASPVERNAIRYSTFEHVKALLKELEPVGPVVNTSLAVPYTGKPGSLTSPAPSASTFRQVQPLPPWTNTTILPGNEGNSAEKMAVLRNNATRVGGKRRKTTRRSRK
jgi:hypothetical protein